jgi:hypothetical protein
MSKIKVFLSHKHEFKDSAKRLQWNLGRLAPDRFDFFASSADIRFGQDWLERVNHELSEADWLIALTTQCEGKSKEWIVREISSFCELNKAELDNDSQEPQVKRCIIIHDEGDRLDAFSNLQQFPATRDGCQEFLRRLLASGRGCFGFNPYIGDNILEFKKEAERLWETLVASPPPFVLLPKGKFWLTPENERRLNDDLFDDGMTVTLDRKAAGLHNINLHAGANEWEGTFRDLHDSMSEAQKCWLPLMAFLLRKVLRQKRIQEAFILYPDYSNARFYNPVVNQLYEYPSGDKLFELIYFPVETAFETRNLSQRDQLFQLVILCIHTQWRLIDRYREEVENVAAKERSQFVHLSDSDKEQRTDLNKRVLIDLMKIHSESTARGLVNPEKILSLFPESERKSVADDFQRWIGLVQQLEMSNGEVEAAALEGILGQAGEIVERMMRKYSALVASVDQW